MISTKYTTTIKNLIKSLEDSLQQDLGDPDMRHNCASAMYSAYYQINDPAEKDLATKIMNDGGYLEEQTALEIDHPMYDQDILDFKKSLKDIIDYLNEVRPS